MYTNYADSTQFECGLVYSYIARECSKFALAFGQIGGHPCFANFKHAIARGWVLV